MLARAADITRSPGDPKVLSKGASSSLGASDRLARNLGWFSIGLGVVELVGARRLASLLGMRGAEGLIRAYGAREIAAGMMSLSANPNPGIKSRIVGDAIDIVTLLAALRHGNPRRGNVEVALLAVAGITVLDLICQKGLTSRHARAPGPYRDYRDRSGFPQGVNAARGAARKERQAPEDKAGF
ncbi:hypothetical protein J8J14_16345 [Roseomonas sp. SSH11]|uniref:DUF4267 domain-containing protein n=1 Tax=Pararoseomonas baculiformis TaxID=2820812 RepID=A0ABS4AH68_9PROT|nr:hypothetical protein [Pararoseomonas baculiformis]MBP0446345.1 hypothetical protein [Pararoseomonas baculiformis]